MPLSLATDHIPRELVHLALLLVIPDILCEQGPRAYYEHHDVLVCRAVNLAPLHVCDKFYVDIPLLWDDELGQKLKLRAAIEMTVGELEAHLLRYFCIHFCRVEPLRMFTQEVEEARYNLLHLVFAVLDARVPQMLVSAYVLRERMCLLLEQRTFLYIDLEKVLRPVVPALIVVFRLNQVGKRVIDVLEFDLDLLVH